MLPRLTLNICTQGLFLLSLQKAGEGGLQAHCSAQYLALFEELVKGSVR